MAKVASAPSGISWISRSPVSGLRTEIPRIPSSAFHRIEVGKMPSRSARSDILLLPCFLVVWVLREGGTCAVQARRYALLFCSRHHRRWGGHEIERIAHDILAERDHH